MERSHMQRWLTAIILLPLLFFIIMKGGVFLFGLLITVVSLTAYYEWASITSKGIASVKKLVYLPYILIPALFFTAMMSAKYFFVSLLLSSGVLVFAGLLLFEESKDYLFGFLILAAGFCYTAIFPLFISRIRMKPDGISIVFFLILCVFASDTGAFYSGRKFGKHKMMPKVSPKKTMEGFVGGFIFSMVVALSFKLIFLPHVSFLDVLLAGFFIGIAVPVGDLFESMVKRIFKVKDSGTILPGHGGILDRIDGLLFAAPVIYILM